MRDRKPLITVKAVFRSKACKDYVELSKEIKRYCRDQVPLPLDLEKKYKKALANYRIFLDKNNIRLQESKFPYNKRDKATWKFLDVITKEAETYTVFMRAVLNYSWVYYSKALHKPNNNNFKNNL